MQYKIDGYICAYCNELLFLLLYISMSALFLFPIAKIAEWPQWPPKIPQNL